MMIDCGIVRPVTCFIAIDGMRHLLTILFSFVMFVKLVRLSLVFIKGNLT